jgi:alkylhydroperoxidase family enzyme
MSTLEAVEWECCLVEPRRDPELERQARRTLGAVPHALRYLAACPWLAELYIASRVTAFQLVHVAPELHDLIWLAVSQDNSCRYCYASQRAMMRILGFSGDRIRRLEESFFSAELDPRERLAIEFAKRISRANPMPVKADAQALLDAGYSWDAVKEVAYVASYTVAGNRVATLLAIPPEPMEQMPDRWAIRLARPLLAWMLRRHQPWRLEIATPEPSDADPFSYLVRALGELPIAHLLHGRLARPWASDLLPRRAKALVFAVVARGLGCPLCEREACRLLAEQGLEREEIDRVLAHLGSPALDPVEAEIVPFARETIWCRPAEIQRRGRQLLNKLSAAQFLELAGVAGIANMVCRLSSAVEGTR